MNQVLSIIIWSLVIGFVLFLCYKFIVYVFSNDFSDPEAEGYVNMASHIGGALLLLNRRRRKQYKKKR